MEYNIRELSQLAGVSARTLRYYDQIGLLNPSRIQDSGYRFYGEKEVDLLQQILFYRERGLGLAQIAGILYQEGFDAKAALQEHLEALQAQQERTARLIETIRKTISSMKGETHMKDREKLKAFQRQSVADNDKKYGKELRQKYGEDAVNASNRKILSMNEKEYEHFQKLEAEILKKLRTAVRNGETPADGAGREIALLHRDWLRCTVGNYSPALHRGIADLYVCDPRFTEYYDREVTGCAAFLREAVRHWIKE